MTDDKDQLINAFRPIEQLFIIMDKTYLEDNGPLPRAYAEVGLALCSIFRNKIEEITNPESKKKNNE